MEAVSNVQSFNFYFYIPLENIFVFLENIFDNKYRTNLVRCQIQFVRVSGVQALLLPSLCVIISSPLILICV